jgi:hypothetical protein
MGCEKVPAAMRSEFFVQGAMIIVKTCYPGISCYSVVYIVP